MTAQITGGALRLIGDSESNQVLIQQNVANGVTVSSLDGTTTINGSLEPVTLTGLRKGIHLAAGDGDDVFRFANQAGSQFDVNGMANLNMGSGNDTLELLNFAAGANVVVNMGAGNDTVDVRNASLRMGVFIGGSGFDTFNRVNGQFRNGPVVVQFESRTQVSTPIATPDSATVEAEGTVDIDLAANDQGVAAALDLTSIVITQDPVNGDVEVNADGTVTYTHDGSAATSDSFRYTIEDVDGRVSNEAVVTITVSDEAPTENDPPTIGAVADVTTNVSTATGPISVTLADDTTAATAITLAGTSSNPALVPNANIATTGAGGTRTVIVTPVAGATGASTITLTATDSDGASATETFVVTVNGAPTISNVANQTTSIGTAVGPLAVTVGDDLTAAGSLTLSATSSNTTLVPSANIQLAGSGAARTVLVTPAAGATGTTTITLTVTDAGGLTATDTFTVTVDPQNTAPTITAVADATVNNNATLGPVSFTINDAQTAATALQVTATSSNQAVVANSGLALGGTGSSRTVVVTPVAGASGTSTITLTVTDAANATVTETFVVTVNASPTITNVADQTIAEDAATSSLAVTVGDDTTAAGSLVLSATSSNTSLIPNANIQLGGSGAARTVVVTPVANASGSSTITLNVADANGLSATETFTVTVTPANDSPTIDPVADVTTNLNTQVGPIAATIGDQETPAASLTLAATSSNQAVVSDSGIQLGGSGSARTVLITPVTGASGAATITLTVTDANSGTATETFVVTVNGAPTISNVVDQTVAEDTATGSLAVTVGDDVTAAGSLVLSATSSNTTLVPNANIQLGGSGSARTVVVNPAADASGSSTITLTVTDGGGVTATDTFTVTVTPANDPPVVLPELFTVVENSGVIVSGDLLTNDTNGGDGGALTITALSNGTVGTPFVGLSGTFQINANGTFTFDLDDTIAAVDQLLAGQELFEEIQYTVSDGTDTSIGTLRIRIQGAAG